MAIDCGGAWRGVSLWLTWASLAAFIPAPAAADAPSISAREHFERGYTLARDGAFEGAIAEFQLAYATSPHYSVLFNLAQAYGAAGHAVEAAHTLERYLELGSVAIDVAQRQRVNELMAYYRQRVGLLAVDVQPAGASVVVDGQMLGTTPLRVPVELTAGVHGLAVTMTGYAPVTASVRVSAGDTERFEAVLSKAEGAPLDAQASVQLSCALPEVTVAIDGRAQPVGEQLRIAVAPGPHQIQVARSGYETHHIQSLQVAPGETYRVPCDLVPDAKALGLATLRVAHPEGTRVLVDGRDFTGQRLPQGAHELSVSGEGYETARRQVRLATGANATVTVTPPRASALLENERAGRATTQKILAYVVGGTALATAAGAITLWITNNARYAAWQDQNAAFTSSFARNPSAVSLNQLNALLTDENAIRNRDSLALGLGVTAATLLATSVALYFTAGGAGPTLTVTARGEPRVGYLAAW